jgi:hypothetical protein
MKNLKKTPTTFKKSKVEKLDHKLIKNKETTCNLKSSINALQDQHDASQKTHQNFKMQYNAL